MVLLCQSGASSIFPASLPSSTAIENGRDVCNSVEDAWLPHCSCYDWFKGHSWEKGTFPSGDGKDEESTSEDYHCHYGIKMWGILTENKTQKLWPPPFSL